MKIVMSALLQHATPEMQEMWVSQFVPWTKFFKKAAGGAVRCGKKWRSKIQAAARYEIDRTIAAFNQPATKPSLPPTVCQKGCAHCCHRCHYNVDINVLEAERLADIVRQMPDDRREEAIRRLRSADEAYRQADQRLNIYRHPCPFLEGGACSIYEDRPLTCRSHVSTDVTFCITELNTTKATLWPGDPGVTAQATNGKAIWHILLQSIAAAASELIGHAGSMPAAVLNLLEAEE